MEKVEDIKENGLYIYNKNTLTVIPPNGIIRIDVTSREEEMALVNGSDNPTIKEEAG